MTRAGNRAGLSSGVSIAVLALVAACARREVPGHRLASALRGSSERPTQGRLVDLPYAPSLRQARGGGGVAEGAIRVRAVAAELTSELGNNAPEARHAQAVAELMVGNRMAAVKLLDRLSREHSKNARYWNDLAAARLELARQTDDVEMLASALAAAEYAMRLHPSLDAAAFNRAMTLDALRIGPAAQRAFRDYLARDGVSEWAREIRNRISQRSTTREEWSAATDRLKEACTSAERAGCMALVRHFPQQARSWAEGDFLARWGEETLKGRPGEAMKWLTISRSIGDALHKSSGEELLVDAVAAVDRAVRSRDDVMVRELAAAHVLYRTVRIQYSKRLVTASAPVFIEVERRFRGCGTPMAIVAAYYRATVAFDGNDDALAISILEAVAGAVPHRYKALRAQVEWTRGVVYVRDGRLWEGLQSVTAARDGFMALGETDNTTRMRSLSAGILTMLGRPADAWRERREIFDAVTTSGNESLIEGALADAAVDAMVDQRWDIAAALFNQQAILPAVSPRKRAEAFLFATYGEARAGWIDPLAADFTTSRVAASQIADAKLRDETLDAIRFAEATLARPSDPHRALQMLTACVDFRSKRALTLRLREAYVERAKAFRLLGRQREALLDLGRAIESLEQTRTAIQRDDLRDSFFGTAENAFDEAIDIHLSRGEYEAAFDVAERGRARMLLDRMGAPNVDATKPLSLSQIQLRLPARTALVVFSTLADRTFAAAVTRRAFRGTTLPVGRERFETIRESLVAAIKRGDAGNASVLGRQLFDLLFAPLQSDVAQAKTIIIVPDDTMAGVPYAVVINPNTGRFLIEDMIIGIAPSANTYVRGAMNDVPSPLRAALIGDPAFSVVQFPQLSRLPEAREEVMKLAALYGNQGLLTGSDASIPRVKAALADADIIDIAAHAIVNERNPQTSVLLLAAIGVDSGALYLSEAAALRLNRSPIVVLAGCRTAVSGEGHGTVKSFALAFLSAGSRAVLGTLWDIDDANARAMSLAFHHRIRSGATPLEALRDAQLQMLYDRGSTSEPMTWGSYQMYITQ